jgi:hypothetical protein
MNDTGLQRRLLASSLMTFAFFIAVHGAHAAVHGLRAASPPAAAAAHDISRLR